MNIGEQIFEALTDVGADLVDMAEHQRFARSPWQKVLSAAACLTVIAGLGAAVWQYLPTLTPHAPEVIEQPEVMEYPADPKVEEATEETEKSVLWEPEHLPFYVFDPDPDRHDDPAKAIAPDGSVLVETQSGKIQPLVDEKTGEYVSILVHHLPQGDSLEGAYLEVYDLEGNLLTEYLMAYETKILGDIQVYNAYVDGEYTASLYNRRTGTWIPAVHERVHILGNVMVAEPVDGQQAWVYDHKGQSRQLPAQMASYLLEDGVFYVIVGDGTGHYGLEDAFGNTISPCVYTSIVSARNGYAHCEDETGHYAVDLTTGDVVFTWAEDILEVWQTHVVVQKGDRCLLLTRDGEVVAEANAIEVLDDNDDAIPDLFYLTDGNTRTFLDQNALTQDVFTTDSIVNAISAHAAAVITEEDFAILNWELGRTITGFEKDYVSVRVFQEETRSTGLFYAAAEEGIDLIREDGTVLLENVRDTMELQGDVTFCIEDGFQGLKKLDGTWLYQERIE